MFSWMPSLFASRSDVSAPARNRAPRNFVLGPAFGSFVCLSVRWCVAVCLGVRVCVCQFVCHPATQARKRGGCVVFLICARLITSFTGCPTRGSGWLTASARRAGNFACVPAWGAGPGWAGPFVFLATVTVSSICLLNYEAS